MCYFTKYGSRKENRLFLRQNHFYFRFYVLSNNKNIIAMRLLYKRGSIQHDLVQRPWRYKEVRRTDL